MTAFPLTLRGKTKKKKKKGRSGLHDKVDASELLCATVRGLFQSFRLQKGIEMHWSALIYLASTQKKKKGRKIERGRERRKGPHLAHVAAPDADDPGPRAHEGDVGGGVLGLAGAAADDARVGAEADEGAGLHAADGAGAAGDEGYFAIWGGKC